MISDLRIAANFCKIPPLNEIPFGINAMKADIHPEYKAIKVTCRCGNSFETASTDTSGEMEVDICSACHPFYTGQQKVIDSGGRVDRFRKRYNR